MFHPPHLQYLPLCDGAFLACTVWGEGLPLVRLPGWLSHQRVFVQHPAEYRFAEALAALAPPWMEITYDQRGTGLSREGRTDFSLSGMVAELAAVVDHLQLPRVALLCESVAGMVGIAYAVQHPERVSHLIVANAAARGASFALARLLTAIAALTALEPAEWEIGAEILAQLFFTSDAPDIGRAFAHPRDEAGAAEMALALWAAYRSFDVTALLPHVNAPTLVLHSRGDRLVPLAAGVELATSIPEAQFLPVEGHTHALLRGAEAPTVGQVILRFLQADALVPSATAVVVRPVPSATLTRQQLHVLRLIAEGKTSREIAAALVLSERTVQRHIANLYRKIGVHNRAEATAFALHLARA